MDIDLNEIRKELDVIDNEIVVLIAKRMKFMPDIAKYKLERGMELFQPEREKIVLESKRELAKKHGINCDLVEDVFKLLMDDAKRIQSELK